MKPPQGKREALETRLYAFSIPHKRDIMAVADAYGDERELAGHVGACGVAGMTVGEHESTKVCGDGWYCEAAPRRPA